MISLLGRTRIVGWQFKQSGSPKKLFLPISQMWHPFSGFGFVVLQCNEIRVRAAQVGQRKCFTDTQSFINLADLTKKQRKGMSVGCNFVNYQQQQRLVVRSE